MAEAQASGQLRSGWVRRASNAASRSLRSLLSSPDMSRAAANDAVRAGQESPSQQHQREHGAAQATQVQGGKTTAARSQASGQHRLAPVKALSPSSSPGIPDSLFYAEDFMIGAGMVVLQPETAKVVVVFDTERKIWFLPKGRKDVGESLEQAALREAYEESGFRAQFFPLFIPTNAPTPPAQRQKFPKPNTEPFYVETVRYNRRRRPQAPSAVGGEYFVFWYIGQIPADAVWEANTGMADEQGYRAHLLTHDEALQKLGKDTSEGLLVHRAYAIWESSKRLEEQIRRAESSQQATDVPQAVPPATSDTHAAAASEQDEEWVDE